VRSFQDTNLLSSVSGKECYDIMGLEGEDLMPDELNEIAKFRQRLSSSSLNTSSTILPGNPSFCVSMRPVPFVPFRGPVDRSRKHTCDHYVAPDKVKCLA
jgi:hypothetical protein